MVFLRAQFSAFVGGVSDYIIMIACVEFLGMHYIPAIAVGAVFGAVINYAISRSWAFKAEEEKISSQFIKYAVVSLGSLFLKTIGTFTLTEYIHIDYRISKLLTDGIVAFGFNYTLQRYWVFKQKPITEIS